MKKVIAIFAALICLLGVSAGAKNLYDRHWQPGEYAPEITGEDAARYAALWERVLALSAGTVVREANEAETLAVQYEKFLRMGEVPERFFDDVGAYTWAVGLPDEAAISQEAAYAIACAALMEQYDLLPEELAHYWPHYSYVTADPQQPVWQIDFICYDGTRTRAATVSLYALDGSVRGVRYDETAG